MVKQDTEQLHLKVSAVSERIRKTSEDVSYIRGKLDTVLPGLATKTDIELAVSNHSNDCKNRKTSKLPTKHGSNAQLSKTIGAVTAALVGLSGAVWALIEAIK
jgi:hypothetical protein